MVFEVGSCNAGCDCGWEWVKVVDRFGGGQLHAC